MEQIKKDLPFLNRVPYPIPPEYIVKEIKTYGIVILPQWPGVEPPFFAYIHMYDESGSEVVIAAFVNRDAFEDHSGPPTPQPLGVVTMSFRAEQFPMVLDLLRNEKPVYLVGRVITPTWSWFWIGTDVWEPVGEGEETIH